MIAKVKFSYSSAEVRQSKMFDFRDLEEPQPFTETEQRAIDDLKLMFKQNTEINFQTDNYFLTKFLRYRDWNVAATYKSIVTYYELKVNKL